MDNEEHQLIKERRQKLSAWRATGDAYPNDFAPQHRNEDLQKAYGDKSTQDLAAEPMEVSIAGRIMLRRLMGKASFATLQDGSGRMQIYISDKQPGREAHAEFCHWDTGDIIGVVGRLFRTRTGELTVECHSVRLLAKCLRALPEKFHGLTDVELRQRQRYLDLIINEDSRRTVLLRSRAIAVLRDYLTHHNFIEVETPMMHQIPGGAAARPFLTHHHSLDMDLYLRIAPELYLKRLVVGGLERVFELNRNFRNEGISPRHNPEFTMLEFYQAYSHHQGMMQLTEEMLQKVVRLVSPDQKLTYQGRVIDFSRPFRRLPMLEALRQHGYSDAQIQDHSFLRKTLGEHQVSTAPTTSLATLQLGLFEEVVEATLHDPVFITDYPLEVSPLARAARHKPEIAERFELFIAGREIANGFSELNDPEDQASRLHQQAQEKSADEHHGMYFDEDYIQALEYALPPTGGCGIGIDRLIMLLADKANIRDVILFPLLRPQH